MSRATFVNRVAAHFRAHPFEWIDARDLEVLGGRQAWRTRVSDCRRQLSMTIVNRQRDGFHGTVKFTISEYQYQPYQPLGRDPGELTLL